MSNAAKGLLREQSRRNRFQDAVEEAAAGAFEQQLAVLNSPAKRMVVYAGRRSGKTSVAMPRALRAAAKFPGSIIPVCERSLHCAAANSFWKSLKAFDAANGLGIQFRETVREAVMPNRSRIQLYGVDTIELADKLRGEGYPLVIGDEMGTFRSHVAAYLVDEVLSASMIDYDGSIMLIGTPSLRRTGYWFDVCHSPAWERHHWTLLDNPMLGKMAHQRGREWREEYVKDLILAKGWLDRDTFLSVPASEVIAACKHPQFRREFLGEWVETSTEAMYSFRAGANTIYEMPVADPRRPWRYGLSMDLGFNDATAFTISATRAKDPTVYFVDCMQKTEMTPTSIAAQVDRYKLVYPSLAFIVADTGGGHKMAVEEMNTRFGLGIIAAQKKAKLTFVEHMNGDFLSGRIKLLRKSCADLIADYEGLPWNEDRTDAHPEFPDHLPDSALYNYRQWMVQRAWGFGHGERDAPEPGSEAWYAAQDEEAERLGDDLAKKDAPPEGGFWGKDPDFDSDFDT